MSYTPATIYPQSIKVFQWSTPANPNPRLAAPITAAATTITVTSAPLDYDGSPITGGFLMGLKNSAGYTETVYVPVGGVSGTTLTGCVRGVRLAGLDYTTAGSGLAAAFDQDSPVYCNISAVLFQMMMGAFGGVVASGGTSWLVGLGTDVDISVKAYNADTNKPFFRYEASSNQWVYSNDGVSSTPFGTGGGVTGGGGITISSGVISVNLTDTSKFVQTSSGAGDSGKVPVLNGSGQLAAGFINLSGATVTQTISSLVAGEAVDGSTTPQLVCISDGSNGKTAGRFYKADADDFVNYLTRPMGFVNVNAATPGSSYSVITNGIVTGFTGLTQGATYYSSTTPGAITATIPTSAVDAIVGMAITTTSIELIKNKKVVYGSFASSVSLDTNGTVNTDVSIGFKPRLVNIFVQFGANGFNSVAQDGVLGLNAAGLLVGATQAWNYVLKPYGASTGGLTPQFFASSGGIFVTALQSTFSNANISFTYTASVLNENQLRFTRVVTRQASAGFPGSFTLSVYFVAIE